MIKEALERINESVPNKNEILRLAKDKKKTPQSTNELRKLIELSLGIKKSIPKITTKDPIEFTKVYNHRLKKYKVDMLKIFDFREDVGRGELLLAYLSDYISIGGTGQTYDVDFINNKIEVKEVLFGPETMYNFRLGKESKKAMSTALRRLKYLWEASRWFYPDLNTSEFSEKIETGQELTKLIKLFKTVDVSKLNGQEKVELYLNKKGRIYFDEKEVTRLEDPNLLFILQNLIKTSSRDIISYSKIEKDLINEISAKDIQYYFFEVKTGVLYYRKNLKGSFIHTITQGSIKLKVPY